jgi:hypothetical protein
LEYFRKRVEELTPETCFFRKISIFKIKNGYKGSDDMPKVEIATDHGRFLLKLELNKRRA